MPASNYWIADTPISMPAPPTLQVPITKEFEGTGFGMTNYGIAVVITEADREEMFSNCFGPPDGR
jgi:hypothetical protein